MDIQNKTEKLHHLNPWLLFKVPDQADSCFNERTIFSVIMILTNESLEGEVSQQRIISELKNFYSIKRNLDLGELEWELYEIWTLVIGILFLSPKKASYITEIMTLPSGTQTVIMELMQYGMDKYRFHEKRDSVPRLKAIQNTRTIYTQKLEEELEKDHEKEKKLIKSLETELSCKNQEIENLHMEIDLLKSLTQKASKNHRLEIPANHDVSSPASPMRFSKEEVDDLKNQIHLKQVEMDRLRESINVLRSEKQNAFDELSVLQNRLETFEDLQYQVSKYKQKISSLMQMKSQMKSMKTESEIILKENEELRVAIENQKRKEKTVVGQWKDKLANLQQKFDILNLQRENSESKRSDLRKKFLQMENENQSLKKKLKDLKDTSSVSDCKDEVQNNSVHYRKQILSPDVKNTSIYEPFTLDLQKKMSNLVLKVETLEQENQEFSQKLKSKSEEIFELKSSFELLQTEHKDLQDQCIDIYQQEVTQEAVNEEELSHLRKQVLNLTKAISDQNVIQERLEIQNKALMTEHEVIRRKERDSRKSIKKMQKKLISKSNIENINFSELELVKSLQSNVDYLKNVNDGLRKENERLRQRTSLNCGEALRMR